LRCCGRGRDAKWPFWVGVVEGELGESLETPGDDAESGPGDSRSDISMAATTTITRTERKLRNSGPALLIDGPTNRG